MTIKLLHQVGHCSNWNLESFTQDGCGDGLIFSPVHQSSSQIIGIEESIKEKSFIDPQYYLPNSQKKKLHTYNFFPEFISQGFETVDFSNFAKKSAEECINFQLKNNFDRIIIPARYFDQMIPDYTEKQETYTVKPFLETLMKIGTDKPIYITLPLTSHMVINSEYRISILNWITTFPEIQGVYLFIATDRKTKQITDENFIFSYLEFCKELREAELELTIGYLNSESLLFSLIDNITITMGAYENTRMFSIDKFLTSDDERRGPKPRIYLPGLLNWIQFGQAKEIRNDLPDIWSQIYKPTKYGDLVLNAAADPAFNQANLYKHFFLNFTDQISVLNTQSTKERYSTIRETLKSSISFYSQIEDAIIDLEVHGKGDHIQSWLNAINRFSKKYIINE